MKYRRYRMLRAGYYTFPPPPDGCPVVVASNFSEILTLDYSIGALHPTQNLISIIDNSYHGGPLHENPKWGTKRPPHVFLKNANRAASVVSPILNLALENGQHFRFTQEWFLETQTPPSVGSVGVILRLSTTGLRGRMPPPPLRM